MISLGKNPGIVQNNLNTTEYDANEYIVSRVIAQTISVCSQPQPCEEIDSTDSMSVSSKDLE